MLHVLFFPDRSFQGERGKRSGDENLVEGAKRRIVWGLLLMGWWVPMWRACMCCLRILSPVPVSQIRSKEKTKKNKKNRRTKKHSCNTSCENHQTNTH